MIFSEFLVTKNRENKLFVKYQVVLNMEGKKLTISYLSK